jgi:head-tail adaptor
MEITCTKNIRQALELARLLTILADEGEAVSQDDGCRLLYAIVRDCAYKIRAQAQRERQEHTRKGIWIDNLQEIQKAENKE